MWPFTRRKTTNRLDNKWTGGDVDLVMPPLSGSDFGVYGSRFYNLVFQRHVGEETFLCIFEETEWAKRYGQARKLTLHSSTMLIRTDLGPVGLIIWHILNGRESLCTYEHHFDPLSAYTNNFLRKVSQQTRLKLVMRDNRTGSVTGFWEFDNIFKLDEAAETFSMAKWNSQTFPFDQRVKELERQYTSNQLMAMAMCA